MGSLLAEVIEIKHSINPLTLRISKSSMEDLMQGVCLALQVHFRDLGVYLSDFFV